MEEERKNRRGRTREGGDFEISPRQQATLDALRDYWARHKIGPSRADLANALGLQSQSGTDRHIQALLRRGLVELVPGASRSLRVVESGEVPLIEAKGRVSHRNALTDDVHRSGWIPDCLAAKFSPRPDFFLVITDEKLCRVGVATGDLVACRKGAAGQSRGADSSPTERVRVLGEVRIRMSPHGANGTRHAGRGGHEYKGFRNLTGMFRRSRPLAPFPCSGKMPGVLQPSAVTRRPISLQRSWRGSQPANRSMRDCNGDGVMCGSFLHTIQS